MKGFFSADFISCVGQKFICADDCRGLRGPGGHVPILTFPAINLRTFKSCLQFFTIPMFKTPPDYLKIK